MTDKYEVAETLKTFEDIKHVDENGKSYWNSRELAKALGYDRYNNFDNAISRSKESMKSAGVNPDDHLREAAQLVKIGSGAERKMLGYKMDQYAAYVTSMNADTTKPQVGTAQMFFAQSGATVNKIVKTLNDKEYIENRNGLKLANKELNATALAHGVKEDELGIVADAGDQGFFGMHTKDVKEMKGIANNRPVADFMGAEMAAFKTTAQYATKQTIINNQAHGVDQVSDIAFDENRRVRDVVKRVYQKNPEELVTGEDVKKVEQRYKKFTKSQLKAIEQEF